MGAFHSIDVAATGAGVSRLWLDTLADNLANLNTIRPAGEEPFRARLVHARARPGRGGTDPGDGVQAAGLLPVAGDPQRVLDPDHPLADEDGLVTRPVVDMAGQMSDLILASRTYQINLEVIRTSREAYEAALRIGRE